KKTTVIFSDSFYRFMIEAVFYVISTIYHGKLVPEAKSFFYLIKEEDSMMHPFHLSQAIYFGIIIVFITVLFVYDKMSKNDIPKSKIIIYSLTIVLVLIILISVYFYIRYDYSLIFPADYYQPHNYLFVLLALFIFGSIFKQKGLDDSKLTLKDKALLC